jgi:hypothetical protein
LGSFLRVAMSGLQLAGSRQTGEDVRSQNGASPGASERAPAARPSPSGPDAETRRRARASRPQ